MSRGYDEYQTLTEAIPGETITHSHLREVPLPGAGTMALIVLDNGVPARPATLGPASLIELGLVLESLKEKADSGDIAAIGITGTAGYLAAGADLTGLRSITNPDLARLMARLGHDVFGAISEMTVPTFAFINGAAIGGGLELALAAHYRSISAAAAPISLPEAYLGLVPGWGGVHRLPCLIGPGSAIRVMVQNPLNNNKALNGQEGFELGVADAIFEQETFLDDSVGWAAKIVSNGAARKAVSDRRSTIADFDITDWDTAIANGRAFVEKKTGNAAPAPGRLLDLMLKGAHVGLTEAAQAEEEALAELILTPEFRNSAYAFLDLLQRRSKHPRGEPDRQLARPVTKVGIVGAGLMASQLALLFARQLKVPVVMTDIDPLRLEKGVDYVHNEVSKLMAKGRINENAGQHTKSLVTGSVSKDAFHDADFVIEAVFEELSIKKQVLHELEASVQPDCILATNTSALSVTDMAADLQHPGRLIGFHFFNPVAAMPLLEVIPTAKSTEDVLATAFVLARDLEKVPVLVQDETGFVVNRLLLRLMGEVVKAFDDGTPAHVADSALKPLGLPMTAFDLLAMVGFPVAQHVTEALHRSFGPRFPLSANLQTLIDHGITKLWTEAPSGRSIPPATLDLLRFGQEPLSAEELLLRCQDALALEIQLMLTEGVVAAAEDIDLCMLLGAGWPLHLGGITPYLDRTGASTRVNGRTFH